MPVTIVRTLADASTSRSSQKGATTAFGASAVGIAGFTDFVVLVEPPKERKPFVLTYTDV